MSDLKRYYFRDLSTNEKHFLIKYGQDPVDALFRFQLSVLQKSIDPKVFARGADKKEKTKS